MRNLLETCFWAFYRWSFYPSSSSSDDHFEEGETLLPQFRTTPGLMSLGAITQPSLSLWTEFLVDSGAYAHVCPKSFALQAKLWKVDRQTAARTADVRVLLMHGIRRIKLQLERGGILPIEFAVYDTYRPILSVSALVQQGATVVFGNKAAMEYGGLTHRLVSHGNLHFLHARLLAETGIKEVAPSKQWHVFEWCCERDSLLAGWFLEHGHLATRLGLPDYDLSRREDAGKVCNLMLREAGRGHPVLWWISLPCTAWCAWQTINVGAESTVEAQRRVEEMRQESRALVAQVLYVLTALKRATLLGDLIHVAFEWPRFVLDGPM